jgi:uncharacterized protein (TIGR03083 family)
MTPEEFEEIVAAYALDAIEPDDAERIEAYIAERPEAMADVERLRAAAVWYGATDALAPPARLRASVLGRARAARESRPVVPASATGAELSHIEACDYMRDALATVAPEDLGRVTANGLTIRELTAHLAGMESQVVGSVGNPRLAAIDEVEVEARTEAVLETTREWTFEEIVAEWETATATTRAVANERDTLVWFDGELPTSIVETFRAFETWIHASDIDVVMGRERRSLSDAAFGQMAALSAQLVPRFLDARGSTHEGQTARLVLTGVGASEFVIPLAPGGDTSAEPSVTLELPVLEWCMRVGDRIEADDIAMTVTGDVDLAREIIEAANSLAML